MKSDVMFDWPEMLSLLFLVGGFFMAIFSDNAMALYTVCFLTGLLFGRVWYKFKLSHCIPVFLVIMSFFLGFILGGIFANLRIIALALLAGILIGYWLHSRKIIRTA
jgi:4-hydroxybenzoate polyprenyltransferase